jgi:hypothetical protein
MAKASLVWKEGFMGGGSGGITGLRV